ncbi:undecaprenyl-diphosphate phosphatase [Enterococcus sp. BWB1-3]|uniref:undecaprenyl-diphosphate phosphatase n=1 Tax=unclassified Enterococcus TaxID=2608891 RepID=UPI0019207DE8|nr:MULTISPECIES: undecaprenyl-diphosphate phosphatase [unclassified Enterococcus]MBL1229518.1 undecaprenyl-diphosphate phosphatase [Enterococcus sp. BWB1-3]MCB5950791.1 undecaprenyl-diphosphate phosphatase [Enterococcus sp. BWT-B8]MCB5955232.1 undecaprenyl-diphosphate phosphatase [Enterococcus sp. CWB-B31]
MLSNLWKAIILGIIEGITEWLPISSTGHLILTDEFIKMNLSADFMEMFNVVIQLGAIMAVVVLYFHKLNPFSNSKSEGEKRETWELWKKVLVACVPAGIIGIFLDDWLDARFHNFVTVSIMLIVYGIGFIVIEKQNKNKQPKCTNLKNFTYKAAVIVGFFQVLSLIPGTSRSGATILGAIMIGASRYVAAEFSFFLGIPVMFGASFLKIAKYLMKGNSFNFSELFILLVGAVVAFLVSVMVIKFLLNYIRRHDFTAFGWYRIVLGILLMSYWLFS